MNSTVKKKWIAALRSGKYVQGNGQLREMGKVKKHCCLGVLCDLYFKEKKKGWTTPMNFGDSQQPIMIPSIGQAYLPLQVKKWAGLTSHNPIPSGDSSSLARMNDSPTSFSTIADIIENGL